MDRYVKRRQGKNELWALSHIDESLFSKRVWAEGPNYTHGDKHIYCS